MKINRAKEIEKAQNELDDCIESLSVLDNACLLYTSDAADE